MSDKEYTIYCAGILEGEGSFIKKAKNSISVSCEMTDKDIIKKIHIFLGGKIYEYDRRPGLWKKTYKLVILGEEAERVCRMVLPYMGERRSKKINELLDMRAKYLNEKNIFDSRVNDAISIYKLNNVSLREVEKITGVSRQTISRRIRNHGEKASRIPVTDE